MKSKKNRLGSLALQSVIFAGAFLSFSAKAALLKTGDYRGISTGPTSRGTCHAKIEERSDGSFQVSLFPAGGTLVFDSRFEIGSYTNKSDEKCQIEKDKIRTSQNRSGQVPSQTLSWTCNREGNTSTGVLTLSRPENGNSQTPALEQVVITQDLGTVRGKTITLTKYGCSTMKWSDDPTELNKPLYREIFEHY